MCKVQALFGDNILRDSYGKISQFIRFVDESI